LALRAVADQANLADLAGFLVLVFREAVDPVHSVGPMYFLGLVTQEELGANQFCWQNDIHIAYLPEIGYNWIEGARGYPLPFV